MQITTHRTLVMHKDRGQDVRHDVGELTIISRAAYLHEHPGALINEFDPAADAGIVRNFLDLHLPTETFKALGLMSDKREKALLGRLEELYRATVGYRGSHMPIRDKDVNSAFDEALELLEASGIYPHGKRG